MCTSINYVNGDHYFGRNLDLWITYPVEVVITPRNYPFRFRHVPDLQTHNAIIGMAVIEGNYPEYFEGANDKGLGMAGLNFPADCHYFPEEKGKINLASFEFIPYILGTCDNLDQAREALKKINITPDSVSSYTPSSPLHWQIGDKTGAIVVESTVKGLEVHENPFGVLTNCPPFDFQRVNVSNYLNITNKRPTIRFCEDTSALDVFSTGMGTIGLPGGADSVSRFVKCTFCVMNSRCDPNDEGMNVAEYFHLLGSVQQTSGENQVEEDQYETTLYSCCANTDKGIFYFTTYYNPNVYSVDMNKEDLDSKELIHYKLPEKLVTTCLN